TGYFPSGTLRLPGRGTGRPKRSDSAGASCGTGSHRPLARFRFGDRSQHTDDRQMGRSHYGTWSPAACGQIVRGTRATAVWFSKQGANISSAKAMTNWTSDWPALLIENSL